MTDDDDSLADALSDYNEAFYGLSFFFGIFRIINLTLY
jgi:hypothetical protein